MEVANTFVLTGPDRVLLQQYSCNSTVATVLLQQYRYLFFLVGGGLLIKKIKNSRGWILTVTVLGEPREFLNCSESLRKNDLRN